MTNTATVELIQRILEDNRRLVGSGNSSASTQQLIQQCEAFLTQHPGGNSIAAGAGDSATEAREPSAVAVSSTARTREPEAAHFARIANA